MSEADKGEAVERVAQLTKAMARQNEEGTFSEIDGVTTYEGNGSGFCLVTDELMELYAETMTKNRSLTAELEEAKGHVAEWHQSCARLEQVIISLRTELEEVKKYADEMSKSSRDEELSKARAKKKADFLTESLKRLEAMVAGDVILEQGSIQHLQRTDDHQAFHESHGKLSLAKKYAAAIEAELK